MSIKLGPAPARSSIRDPLDRSNLVRVREYVDVLRPSHWLKNMLILPGVVAAAIAMDRPPDARMLWQVVVALFVSCCVASANYIINEILDAPCDLAHPYKKYRPIPSGRVRIIPLQVMAIGLVVLGLGVSGIVFSPAFVASLAALAVMGVAYNIQPVRTKDIPYVDAISESINNPVRFCIGWYAVGETTWPSASLLASYWAVGTFLMTAKRYAEFRAIGNPQWAAAYRRPFRYYSEQTLATLVILYGLASMFLFGTYAAWHRPALLLSLPLLIAFMVWLFWLTLRPDSPLQEPERLLREPLFLLVGFSLFGLLTFLAT